eukprot:5111918-Amphidinium_carterae.1
MEKHRKKIKEIQKRGTDKKEEVPECLNATTLLQQLLTISINYAPTFFSTVGWLKSLMSSLELSLDIAEQKKTHYISKQ